MIDLRLTGTPSDVEALNQLLRENDQVVVVEESKDYPRRRSLLMARYLKVRLKEPPPMEES